MPAASYPECLRHWLLGVLQEEGLSLDQLSQKGFDYLLTDSPAVEGCVGWHIPPQHFRFWVNGVECHGNSRVVGEGSRIQAVLFICRW